MGDLSDEHASPADVSLYRTGQQLFSGLQTGTNEHRSVYHAPTVSPASRDRGWLLQSQAGDERSNRSRAPRVSSPPPPRGHGMEWARSS